MATVAPIALTEADLLEAAGEASFERGLGCVGAVDGLRVHGRRVTGMVKGTQEYQVLLIAKAGGSGTSGLRGECSCPHGQEGNFCKHCVAVGLAALRATPPIGVATAPGRPPGKAAKTTTPRRSPRSRRVPRYSLGTWLIDQSRDDLYFLITEQLVLDSDWRDRLLLRAAAAAGDVAGVRAKAGELLHTGDYGSFRIGEYPAPWLYAHLVREVIVAIGQLAEAGRGEGAVSVAQEAIGLAGVASAKIRDDLGLITEAAANLVACHLAACAQAPPDQVGLADFLAERTLNSHEPEITDFADYADLLGRDGLARLRELFTAAWQAAGRDASDPRNWLGTRQVSDGGDGEQRALERLLRLTGDVDALVDVIAAGVAGPDGKHLRIARELELAGRPAEALAAAEQGLRDEIGIDPHLADFVAMRYLLVGRAADALTVRRNRFAAACDLASFRLLREAAERTGGWPAARQAALDVLRARGRPCAPVLVDALIDEGDIDAAWQAAASGASEIQWLRLADLIATARPADALAVYLRQAAQLRGESGERAYLRLVRLLTSARDCHRALGTEPAFERYLSALRAEHKRKRKLITLLDKHDLR